MKKLVLMLFAVAMAVSVQAASVAWTTTTMYNAKGEKVKDTATVYVYLLENEKAYTDLTDVWGTYGAAVKKGGENAGASNFKQTSSILSKATNIYAPEVAEPKTTYYAAIIATYGTGDDMMYYAEKASATTGEDALASYAFGLGQIDDPETAKLAWLSAAGGGTDVIPEPTSGLLMVFGLAGLALRRRRRHA